MPKPFKYAAIIDALQNDQLYSPASIARHGDALRICVPSNRALAKIVRQRIRITFARLATKRRFPDNGDGILTFVGQAPTPAWFGWRWKEAIQQPNQASHGRDPA